MKNYIDELDEDKCMEFEFAFHKKHRKFRAIMKARANFLSTITVYTDDLKVVGSFEISSYDCKYKAEPHDLLVKDGRTGHGLSFEDVRRFYLAFMKENFPDYKQDYLEYHTQQAENDLGETL